MELKAAKVISDDYYDLVSQITVKDSHTFFAEIPVVINGSVGVGITPEIRSGKAYVCSLCSNDDSLPMWNYYCKGAASEAYNIGLRINTVKELYEANKNHYSLRILRIVYDEKEKTQIITNLLSELFNIYEKNRENNNCVGDIIRNYIATYINTYRFAFKRECFSHEQEYRAVLYVPDDINDDTDVSDDVTIEYRSGNGLIIPYIEYALDIAHVENVRIGPLATQKDRSLQQESILKEWLNSRGWFAVDVRSSDIPIRY